MKLLIALGNPGAEYEQTRHNVGTMSLEYIAKKLAAPDFEFNKKINGQVAKLKAPLGPKEKKVDLVLLEPNCYVNETGSVVAAAKAFYKVKPEDIIVLQDDLDIPFGNTKISFDKNSGGHRGIDSIMKSLKTKKFYRIRIGTANTALKKAHQQNEKQKNESVKAFVLAKFTPSEREKLKDIFKEAHEKLGSLVQ